MLNSAQHARSAASRLDDVIDRSALEQAREGLGGRDIEEPLSWTSSPKRALVGQPLLPRNFAMEERAASAAGLARAPGVLSIGAPSGHARAGDPLIHASPERGSEVAAAGAAGETDAYIHECMYVG
jgi:hypothetical protein